MGVVTIVVAAEEDESSAIGESNRPLDEWSGIELPAMDTARFATLHCLLTGDSLQTALELYEPIFVAENETAVLRVAGELAERLAAADEETLEAVASELAAAEDFEEEHWDPDDLAALLSGFSDLALLADSQGQVLFLWTRIE